MNTAPYRPPFLRPLCIVAALMLAACAASPPHQVATASANAGKCRPAPLPATLYLRGTMTNWSTRELDAFRYDCDAYYLNVDLQGAQRFRVSDASFAGNLRFGVAAGHASKIEAGSAVALVAAKDAADLAFDFAGAHTLRLVVEGAATAGVARAELTIGPQTYVDPDAAVPADPVARSLRFDSRTSDPPNKWPPGAVMAATHVDFYLSALPGVASATLVVDLRRLEGPQEVLEYSELARVPLERRKDGEREGWFGGYQFDAIGVYGYYFLVDIAGKTYRYENNRDRIFWTREAGSNGLGAVSEVAPGARAVRHFRQTVYLADYAVPDWARDVVFYYIFPERFRNGDPRNDPKPGVDRYQDKTVELHRNWLDKPWLPRSGDGSDESYGNDFFGGDIAGIIEKLDYIADLGANTLYITPLFEAASNHKYDTADFKHIDPHFGSDADFVRLCREAAKRGIRVIPDTSLNHSGSDSLYFDRWSHYPGIGAFEGGRRRTDSPWADWYTFDPDERDPAKAYRGWIGILDLPELNKASPAYRDFAYRAADSVTRLWLDRGASGWRMDVAPWIPDDFWREWRSAVKATKADALTIAETQFDSSKFLLGDEFDSTMNYIFRDTVEAYANGARASEVYRNIELMREEYPPQAFYATMNLLSTHDTARALYDFGYKDDHADAATIGLAKQRLRLAVFFQMIFPGAPTVFYGDEVGVTGGDDPFNRVTYPWADRGGKPDLALLAEFKRLIRLRKDEPVLRRGSIEAPAFIDDHVIALVRRGAGKWAVTTTNNDAVMRAAKIKVPADMNGMTFTEALTGATAVAADGVLGVEVPPMFGGVWLAHGTAQPNVHVLPKPMRIPGLDRERTIRLYLPPGYDASRKRYPVLYMH
ncbi:MAG: glycoside hydrolase family 13 protein, partial [Rudaea sp.]